MKRVIELCEDSIGKGEQHMIIQCPQCEKCRTCKQIREINASSYNEFVEQQVLDQLVKYEEGENGEPGFFISPLPLKPYEINTVRGNRKTANEQNKRMTQRLQNDPQVIEQVKEEMKSLQDAGFIVKLSELPLEEQERLNADFKHFIPTTIAFKETSASTKCRLCWDSSRSSSETNSLNSVLLKGTSEYSVVKMITRFRENLIAVSADIRKFYNTLKLSPEHWKYQMALWRPNLDPDEEPEELVLRVHFYGIRSSGGLCMAAVKKLITMAKEEGFFKIAQVLESAYVDDCNASVACIEELEEVKQNMPEFMRQHGMPIKALAWTGEEAPKELSEDGSINVAGYSWNPTTDKMKVTLPKIFHGEKKKGKFTPETVFFDKEGSLENITKFYEEKAITHELILSKTAALYDPVGFLSPLKVYGAYICRRALIESDGDPLKEVTEDTRKLFLQYIYQVKMMEEVTFARNFSNLKRSESDVLVMCTDAGHNASIMIFYLAKEVNDGLILDFVFSIGNLNNEDGIIPRNELDIINKGTKQAEKLINWMVPRVQKKILITDAKVPLLWLRNKHLRTQPFVQSRVHAICKLFEPHEMFYIKSEANPADLGTKFTKFQNTYQKLGDDSLFRQGPKCLRKGLNKAIEDKDLIPATELNPSKVEKESASLEVVKLHQLVITNDRHEDIIKPSDTKEAINTEELENAEVCLLTYDKEVINNESWMHKKVSGFRTQKATLSVKEKLEKVEEFSEYLISPLRKSYDTVFKSMMCTLKALRCWLKLKPSRMIPKGWIEKRQKISERLDNLDNEINKDTLEDVTTNEVNYEEIGVKKIRKRLNLADQVQRSYGAIEFNILRRKKNEEIQEWKSYPGIEKIVRLSRDIVENNDTGRLLELIKIMKVHESQQSAPIVATIALLVGNKVRNNVSKDVRLLLSDIIRWDVVLIKQKTDWPRRKKFSSTMIYGSIEEEEKMKRIAHGYLGRKTSKEMEQFHTKAELHRIAHYEDGIWIAPTKNTFKSYRNDLFPEKPYMIHQNSPLAWSLLAFIHQKQDSFPMTMSSANMHKQKNTLHFESLKYGRVMHARKILRTIEESCVKCMRRKKQFLKGQQGPAHKASFSEIIRPFEYIQMDLTGRHITKGGKDVYGLVCVCLQTYNTKIYGIESRKLESISLALEVLIQEVGPPVFIACDKEGAFKKMAYELDKEGLEKLEEKHKIQFKFAVPNAHFTTGLVERRMRFIHDCLGKLDMQAVGVSVTELMLMFQYIACKLNKIPYGIRNINTYSEGRIEEIRNSSELLMFICPADWTMFQVPGGIEFSSLKNSRGEAIRSIIEKLEVMKEFRDNEFLIILNKQYSGKKFKEPEKVKQNSVVLLRNIANESKREPMKFARVLKINESKDNAQRILTLEYSNIRKNKEGMWIGTPVIVERSINDVIPIDKAVNESVMNLSKPEIDDTIRIHDDEKPIEGVIEEIDRGEDLDQQDDHEYNEDSGLNDKIENCKNNEEIPVRRSERIKKQIKEINPEDIGENDDEKDKNYKR